MQVSHTGLYADINGARLYYQLTGEGQSLVLIHGFTLDHRMWDDQVEAFAPGHRVISLDLRGFGRSSLPNDPYSHVEDVKALLSYLEIRQAVVLGLSMGGVVAMDFAQAYPEYTRALILADSTWRGFSWSRQSAAYVSGIDSTAREKGVPAARALWLTHPFFAHAREQPAVARRLHAMVEDYTGWHWLHASRETMPPAGASNLTALTMPTLVLVGEYDIPDFQAISDQLAYSIPHAQKLVLAGVGHMSNMEDPAQVNQAVAEFLRT
jgi:pimeloyl-ACP methyl ester carboxylesterase